MAARMRAGFKHLPPQDRLKRISQVDENDCWIWLGPVSGHAKKPYGQLWIGSRQTNDARKVQAHRYSFEIFRGPIPAGILVCHRCDNHRCINPEHLFLGTSKDNTQDAIQKGRLVAPPHEIGEKGSHAKLTDAQVLAIRTDRRISRIVAAEYGVSGTHVRAIRRGDARKEAAAA